MVAKLSKATINRILDLAETHSSREIAALMGLKQKTIANRLCQLKTRPRNELLTLSECVRRTGYLKHQFYRAMNGLRLKLREQQYRGDSRGITEAQLDKMVEWLRVEK